MPPNGGSAMNRIIAILACGFTLAACSMSMPSLDFFKSSSTEVLRIESEPPGADAQTTQGQSCRTPCELTVSAGEEFGISFALNGYQPLSMQIRSEAGGTRLQPNPVYAELQAVKAPAKQKSAPKRAAKRTVAASAPAASGPAEASAASAPAAAAYPWPDPR